MAFFLVMLLVTVDIGVAAPNLSTTTSSVASLSTPLALKPSDLQIPLKYASLKESHIGTNGKLIIHIQDAHVNLSGQKSLAGILDEMMTSHAIPTVLIEGGEGNVSLDRMKALADEDTWKIVANKLLFKGLINGAEYLNLTGRHELKLEGIEQFDLYNANLLAYSKLRGKREKILKEIRATQIALDRIKNQLYPRPLLDYETKKTASSRDSEWTSGIQALFALVDSTDVSLYAGFSEVQKLRVLLRKERAAGLDEKALEQLQMEEAFIEMESLEDKTYRMLLLDEDARKIRVLDRYLSLLKKAYSIQISSREFETLIANEPDFDSASWMNYLDQITRRLGLEERTFEYTSYLDDANADLKAFYAWVNRRDEVFVQNTGRILSEQNQSAAFLITGGYHTENLTRLLREAGYSYVVLTPQVTTETDQAQYETILLQPIKDQMISLSEQMQEHGGKPFADTLIPLAFAQSSGSRLSMVENLLEPYKSFAKYASELRSLAKVIWELSGENVEANPQKASEKIIGIIDHKNFTREHLKILISFFEGRISSESAPLRSWEMFDALGTDIEAIEMSFVEIELSSKYVRKVWEALVAAQKRLGDPSPMPDRPTSVSGGAIAVSVVLVGILAGVVGLFSLSVNEFPSNNKVLVVTEESIMPTALSQRDLNMQLAERFVVEELGISEEDILEVAYVVSAAYKKPVIRVTTTQTLKINTTDASYGRYENVYFFDAETAELKTEADFLKLEIQSNERVQANLSQVNGARISSGVVRFKEVYFPGFLASLWPSLMTERRSVSRSRGKMVRLPRLAFQGFSRGFMQTAGTSA